ncbi:hypothetical protein RhiirA5_428630 [Rhizophagus irregularis]|uniref:Uncharacterized protein n=1 Tax=Rhizophagus irregularis TaxID=588596 RepID=A0A2N0P005_9GLOM|nr:hypothetical protein RhiirA5_428630 [Rhizophagus irregularis]
MSTNELREKLTVLEEIFEETSNLMEWEHINLQAVMDVKKENGFNVGDDRYTLVIEAFHVSMDVSRLYIKFKINW